MVAIQRTFSKITSLILILFLACTLQTGAAPALEEVELTPMLVDALEPRLSNPTLASQFEVLDKLVFGKGNILKIEGKSRKCLLLSLDNGGRRLVKLFDLSSFDLNDPHLKGQIFFNGVFSRAEKTPQGTLEITVTYSRLSTGPGHPYSTQAETFVRRNLESKQQNQAIVSQETKPAPSQAGKTRPVAVSTSSSRENPTSPQESKSSATSQKESGSQEGKPTAHVPVTTQKDSVEESDEAEGGSEPKNKPALLRRNRTKAENPSDSSSSSETPEATRGGIQMKDDQDVVIYRKKKTATEKENSKSSVSSVTGVKTGSVRPSNKEVDGMVLIPEGYVTLGSDQTGDKEKPLHRVFVQAFYIDKYLVTNQDYKKFCEATGHSVPPYWKNQTYPKELENHPVVQVNWQDASAYARWVGKRLPSETEWERAAKGPHSYRYAYGNAYDPHKANTETRKTSPVGSYPPNDFELFDMTGNVNEWTSSLFMPYPYKKDDGREDLKSTGARVLRGGDNSGGEFHSRCLVRVEGPPDDASRSDGFRCARDAD